MNQAPLSYDAKDKLLLVLSTLEDMGEMLTANQSFEDSAKYLLRMLLGTIGISKGAIYTFSNEASILKLQTETGFSELKGKNAKIAKKASRAFSDNSIPKLIDAVPRNWQELLGDLITLWKKSGVLILVPLTVKNELLGMICLGARFMKAKYQADDLDIIRRLTQHISLFFMTQKLLNDSKKANFSLNRKILEMEQIHDVGLAITSLKSLDELTGDIIMRASAILDARFGGLWVCEKGLFSLVSAFGFNIGSEFPDIMADLRECEPQWSQGNKVMSVAVPLMIRERCVGALTVAGKESRSGTFIPFQEQDIQLLDLFGSQAAVGLENARLLADALEKERLDKEIEVAAEIQRSILPDTYPDTQKLDICARTVPCRTVGGDFYDFFRVNDQEVGFVIADVSGKSVPAALLVSTFHAGLHVMQDMIAHPELVAARMNDLINETTPENKFITAVFILWHRTKETMTMVSAGHEPAILLHKDGSIERIGDGGLVLGLFPGASYSGRCVKLKPGDSLIFYTDGITDSRNPEKEQFGVERLEKCLRQNRFRKAQDILECVFNAISDFEKDTPAADDATLLVITRKMNE